MASNNDTSAYAVIPVLMIVALGVMTFIFVWPAFVIIGLLLHAGLALGKSIVIGSLLYLVALRGWYDFFLAVIHFRLCPGIQRTFFYIILIFWVSFFIVPTDAWFSHLPRDFRLDSSWVYFLQKTELEKSGQYFTDEEAWSLTLSTTFFLIYIHMFMARHFYIFKLSSIFKKPQPKPQSRAVAVAPARAVQQAAPRVTYTAPQRTAQRSIAKPAYTYHPMVDFDVPPQNRK